MNFLSRAIANQNMPFSSTPRFSLISSTSSHRASVTAHDAPLLSFTSARMWAPAAAYSAPQLRSGPSGFLHSVRDIFLSFSSRLEKLMEGIRRDLCFHTTPKDRTKRTNLSPRVCSDEWRHLKICEVSTCSEPTSVHVIGHAFALMSSLVVLRRHASAYTGSCIPYVPGSPRWH